MLSAFLNIFKVPELRNKLLFTMSLLAIYRIGFFVPLPGVNQEALSKYFRGGGAGQVAEYFAIFTGGDLQQSTIFGLGIMPYISAAIIFQLLVTVVPALERLKKEGQTGQKKIQEYTRYATVGLCLVQAFFWLNYMSSQNLLMADYAGWYSVRLMVVLGLTTGTVFLMWLGEQIDEYGIGNGISLIIMAGIIARMPQAVIMVAQSAETMGGMGGRSAMDPSKILFLIVAFVAVVAGSILITQGQRRIPIQQAKQTRGRRVYGGQRQYLPLRVNHGGVMPIIFASSLLIFPGIMFGWLHGALRWSMFGFLSEAMRPGAYLYELCYIGLIYFFAYFWTTVQFQPKEMADQLRDYGSFIPGLRPGKRTADYLERVMERITYVGAAFLAVIAVIPSVVAVWLHIPFRVSAFLGGTGLLICVSVALDLVQRIEANLIMRNYSGFLGSEGGGRIKGAYA
jgi:preprotein translocase subunit SecY